MSIAHMIIIKLYPLRRIPVYFQVGFIVLVINYIDIFNPLEGRLATVHYI